MREIRFRGIDKRGIWHYGYLWESPEGLRYIKEKISRNHWADYQVKLESIGQFTGLRDKNGEEIYDGDIVKHIRFHWYCPEHPENNTDLIDNNLIIYSEEDRAFKSKIIDLTRNKISGKFSGEGYLSFSDERADKNEIEVIGNIYENPKLLGVKK